MQDVSEPLNFNDRIRDYFKKSVKSILLIATMDMDRKNANAIDNTLLDRVTDKVYLDIKIANYTEESTGKNRGATGSGRLNL